MRYAEIAAFVTAGLTAKGYGADKVMPLLNPGPPTLAALQQLSPGPMLFLTVGNGIGPTVEQLYDRPFIVARAIGAQNDYDYAETLAYDVDDLLLAVGGNTKMGARQVLYVTRTGGAPQLIDLDAGNRYHFQTTYITEAER